MNTIHIYNKAELYFTDKQDGATYKLYRGINYGTNVVMTRVFVRPYFNGKAHGKWINAGTYVGVPQSIKSQIKHRTGAYNVIENEVGE